MVNRVEVNVGTGEVRTVALTSAELDAIAAAASAPAPVPAAVTMRQARLALLDAGLLSAVDAAIAAMPGDAGSTARIEWEYAAIVERNWPLVVALAVALGLTSQQVDDLFRLAATL